MDLPSVARCAAHNVQQIGCFEFSGNDAWGSPSNTAVNGAMEEILYPWWIAVRARIKESEAQNDP
ncbi:MAG: hypothetical protein D6753_15010 [Planctomycetota bacterium]|nr:MAG: hypothetical protein D6753_15010 [Planctomycetota bacterium]